MTYAQQLISQFSVIQYGEFFLRIVVACLCGAGIGFERSKRLKEAGVRTHIIVCCAAALMMIVSKYGFADVSGAVFSGTRGVDPARLAAQVISGVSFLGAGVIFKNGSTIKGLTTAAGIWATAGIGLAVGAGMYIMGIVTTVIIALLQILMHKFAIGGDSLVTHHLRFTLQAGEDFPEHLSTYWEERKVQVVESSITYEGDGFETYDLVLKSPADITLQEVNLFLKTQGTIRSISCVETM